MDREVLIEALRQGPILITMNDGRQFEVPSLEFASVSSMSAAVLRRCEDGKLRHAILPLVTMAGIEFVDTNRS